MDCNQRFLIGLIYFGVKKMGWRDGRQSDQRSDGGAALVVSGQAVPFLDKINKALIFLVIFSSRKKEQSIDCQCFELKSLHTSNVKSRIFIIMKIRDESCFRYVRLCIA